MDYENKLQAEVISVYPDKIEVLIDKIEDYKYADNSLKVGSYLQIYDNENSIIISVIENFSIIVNEKGDKLYKLQSRPLGILKGDNFIRGGDSIAIPPKTAEIATEESIKKIYMSNIEEKNGDYNLNNSHVIIFDIHSEYKKAFLCYSDIRIMWI